MTFLWHRIKIVILCSLYTLCTVNLSLNGSSMSNMTTVFRTAEFLLQFTISTSQNVCHMHIGNWCITPSLDFITHPATYIVTF
ncbi:hypothetical protein GDO81_009922 [Engystomops pustulosus]|uniref:Secreted protein n=1 Tax=Engystomops pustulosus TaxID=76066 RepID=A0AAV7BWU3_ENGPU|nr:hypothetical protein GDO81_009922 [Engystomops pustulosus]